MRMMVMVDLPIKEQISREDIEDGRPYPRALVDLNTGGDDICTFCGKGRRMPYEDLMAIHYPWGGQPSGHWLTFCQAHFLRHMQKRG